MFLINSTNQMDFIKESTLASTYKKERQFLRRKSKFVKYTYKLHLRLRFGLVKIIITCLRIKIPVVWKRFFSPKCAFIENAIPNLSLIYLLIKKIPFFVKTLVFFDSIKFEEIKFSCFVSYLRIHINLG